MKKTKNFKFLALGALVALATGALTSCGEPEAKTFTLHEAIQTTPDTWNVHSWKNAEESTIQGFAEMGLYDFALADNGKGYKIIPEMAAENPIDATKSLTAEEIDKYGLQVDSEGNAFTSGQKWNIKLNQKAKWEDGTPITAQTYVESMDALLDPAMVNYRADSWYTGTVVLGNAEGRFKSGRNIYTMYYVPDGQSVKVDPLYATRKTSDDFFGSLFENVVSGYSLSFIYGAVGSAATGTALEEIFSKANQATWGTSAAPKFANLTTDAAANKLYREAIAVAYKLAFSGVPADLTISTDITLDNETASSWALGNFVLYPYASEAVNFSNVGIKKVSDYELSLYLVQPCSLFELQMQLSGNWIVKKDIYDRTKAQVGGLTTTKYATSLENYMSYGPYKLTQFTDSKVIKLEKNEQWYGYTDGKHEGEFQVEGVELQVVAQADTQLKMFEEGQLDDITLRSQDMQKYSTSPYLMYTPQTYTDKIALNSDFIKLKSNQEVETGVNKTILANKNFRAALSWAIDRTSFVQTQTAGSTPALGVINKMYVADTDSGILYRDTVAGKRVISDVYKLDDGSVSSDGFNLAKAKSLITKACEEENKSAKEGHYAIGDKVKLTWVVYNDDWKTAIQDHIDDMTAATVGTPLEGKFEVEMKIDEDLSNTLIKGNAELAMDIWGGAQMNPYGIPDTWINPSNRTCYGFDPSATIEIDINGDGTVSASEKKSNQAWYDALNKGEFSAAKATYEVRTLILSHLEEYMLQNHYFITVRARNSVSLDSFRVKEGTEEYQALVGYGGIRKLKLTQSDQEWEKTAKKGLDYTK